MLDIFNCGATNQYFYDDEDTLWIHGGYLAEKLGFANVTQSITLHTEPSDRQKPEALKGYLQVP